MSIGLEAQLEVVTKPHEPPSTLPLDYLMPYYTIPYYYNLLYYKFFRGP